MVSPKRSSAFQEIPHYIGHRQRLREKFLQGGKDTLADYEIVELFLSFVIPRKDVKPLAKDLCVYFGTLNALFSATPEELRSIKGIGESTIAALGIVKELFVRAARTEIKERPLLDSCEKVQKYCEHLMSHLKKEQIRLFFLDTRHFLIKDEVHQEGTLTYASIYPREIIKRALELGAASLILVHNHPSGDPSPSKADIDITRQLISTAKPLNLFVMDHLIVGKGKVLSLRRLGYI